MLFRQQFEAWQKVVPAKQPQLLPKMGDWCLGSTFSCLCYPQCKLTLVMFIHQKGKKKTF